MQPDQTDKLIQHLDGLNTRLARQYSFRHMFMAGIVYGLGFVLGSAIFATILIGIFGPWFADIPWIRTVFEAGSTLLRH